MKEFNLDKALSGAENIGAITFEELYKYIEANPSDIEVRMMVGDECARAIIKGREYLVTGVKSRELVEHLVEEDVEEEVVH